MRFIPKVRPHVRLDCFLLGMATTTLLWVVINYTFLNKSFDGAPRIKLIPRHYSKNKFNIPSKAISDTSIKNDINNNLILGETFAKDDDILMMGVIREPKDQRDKDEGYHKHAFNLLISNRLGYHRNIPDTRYPLCKKEYYGGNLPKVSVVICFYNEALSTLLRTVHSVLDRSPAHLIEEILLVDDFSEKAMIEPLENYLLQENVSSKVKLFRTPERAGLIRARTFGARKSTGEVLLFLDSHCEVNVGWLEPLLARIMAGNGSTVVCPLIDIINPDTFVYSASPIVKGGFNWGLHFKWDTVPLESLHKKSDYIKPIESPTMAGGLFAINRAFFSHIGEYDEGMDIWGGENLEISFRLWMCGGRLEIVPCSRVGHVFRHRRPYGSPTGEDTLTRNSLRVAHVWMDEYKEYYFGTRPEVKGRPFGNVDERVELRQRLKCKSFDWYVKNVYKDLKLPDLNKKKSINVVSNVNKNQKAAFKRVLPAVVAKYQLQLSGTALCIESQEEVTSKGSLLVLRHCASFLKRQIWYETEKHDIRLAQLLCLDAEEKFPRLYKCHEMGGTQDWRHSSDIDTPFYNPAAGLCLGVEKPESDAIVILSMCGGEKARKWDLRQL